ncbi:MAG: hypothetical protein OEO21_04405 [Candidatus Krumholzibacteria bacterium]|nr:hypothetical protein [Candidatus Krumholzibacteria bacterium]
MTDEPGISCSDASDLILSQAAGRIERDQDEALEAHLAQCVNCRREATETGWLAEQLRTHHARIDDAHLAARLIVEFAESPAEFSDEENETIWAHLDACPRCIKDYERAQTLLAARVDLTAEAGEQAKLEDAAGGAARARAPLGAPSGAPPFPPSSSAPAGWRERLAALGAALKKLVALVPPQRRAAVVTTLVTAAVAVTVAVVYTSRTVTGGPAAQWAPLDVLSSRTPVQELPIRLATRGGGGGGAEPDATLNMRRIDHIVIVVDLDRVAAGADQYQVVITDAQAVEIFRDAIAQKYFDDGRFFLDLRGRRFSAGDYVLQIEAHYGERISIAARSRFTVRK